MQNDKLKLKINEFLLYLIIIFLPTYLVRFSIFGFKANILDVILLLFVIWQLIAHRSSIIANTKKTQYFWPITLILIGATIATLKSASILASLGILKSYFILPILFFVAAMNIVKEPHQKENILRAWFFSGLAVSTIGLFYYLFGEATYDGRLKAFFLSPNHLAMFLAPPFIIGARFLFKENTFKYLAGVVLIGFILFLTKSLGAFFAISITLAFYLFLYFRYSPLNFSFQKEGKRVTAAIAFILLFFLLSTSYFLFSTKDFSEKSSLSSRFMIWSSAIEILKDNAVLGIGPGMFQEKYLEYQKYLPPYLEWAVPQPHNIFLAFWLQAGLVGFIGFLWLLAVFFRNIWDNRRDDIIFLSGILMVYIIIHGLIDTTYWKNDLVLMFWLIILLSLPKITKIAE